MVRAVLFDLVNTLVEESSQILNSLEGYYDIQVKAIHRSLEREGVATDWSLFKRYYEGVRNQQRRRSAETLRETFGFRREPPKLKVTEWSLGGDAFLNHTTADDTRASAN